MSRIYLLLVLVLAGCGESSTAETSRQVLAEQTEYISSVPSQYFRKAEKRGQVIAEHYPSKDYTTGEAITKTAYVYLPYGYEESPRYNIF